MREIQRRPISARIVTLGDRFRNCICFSISRADPRENPAFSGLVPASCWHHVGTVLALCWHCAGIMPWPVLWVLRTISPAQGGSDPSMRHHRATSSRIGAQSSVCPSGSRRFGVQYLHAASNPRDRTKCSCPRMSTARYSPCPRAAIHFQGCPRGSHTIHELSINRP